MRTKAIILSAAMVAAGALSSQAQNVFSQNVVGYVQQTFTPGIFYMISSPLDNGTNTVSSLLSGALNGTSAQLWNQGLGAYDVINLTFTGWKANGTNYNPVVLPGQGFFVKFAAGPQNFTTITNTFLGNVTVAIGGNGTNTVSAGFNAYGSVIPYSDSVTNTTTINLSPVLQNGDNIQKWNVGLQQFDVYNLGFGGNWIISGTNNVPSIGVGEGFFLQNNHAQKSWVETLPAQ